MPHEATIRLATFLVLFVLFAAAEAIWPRRPLNLGRLRRWPTNLGIVVIDQIVLRALALAVPLLAVGAALAAAQGGWGFFNLSRWPVWIEVVASVLVLDFAIWLQHLMFHKVSWLWRLHRVHHADRDIDVTTALRFHPIEIVASMFIKIGVVVLIGAPALAVILFEIILNGTAMFNHANLALSPGIDRNLRRLLVTPDMHRIHHSTLKKEHDSNYGFALSIWDRAFRTYTDKPERGQTGMTIGLAPWQDDRPARLWWALRFPFVRK